MSRKKKIAIIASAVFVTLIVLSMTLLPAAVRSWLTDEIRQTTGRKTHLQSLAFNPLTMTITAKGCALEERGGGPFIKIGGIRASLSPLSIFKRALIVSEIAIDAPSFVITRNSPNTYNFSDIQQRLEANKKPKPQTEEESHFSINNITVNGGSIDFNDLAVPGGRKHTIRNLEIGIPFISNIPYLVEKYTTPKISAVVNGAPFGFAGKMKPLSKSLETSVRIDLKQLDLPELAAYSPEKPPARLAAGKLTIDTDLSYRVFSDKKPELNLKGLLRLDNIAINLNSGQPLLKLPLLEVKASNLELFAKLFQFSSIKVNGLELFVNRDGRGHWMFDSLMPAEKGGKERKTGESKPSPPAKDEQQPSLMISSLALTNSNIYFSDALAKGGFKTSLSDIAFSLKNFSNAPNTSAEYELSLMMDNEANLNSKGNFSTLPLSLKSTTALKGFKLQKGWPYLASYLTAPVKAVIDLSGDVAYTNENGLTAEHANLALKDISTRYGNKDGLALSLFSVSDASFKQKENSLSISDVKLSKGSISVSREPRGDISLLSLIKSKPGIPAKQKPKSSPAKHGTRPFTYHVTRFETDRLNVAFTDKTLNEKPHFTLRNTSIILANLNGPKFTPAKLRCSAIFGRNSPIKTSGDITPLPFRYRGDLSVKRLAIRDFEDYFPDNLNVDVLGGYLDTSLKVDFSLKNGKPEGTFRGNGGVRSFHTVDSVTEEDLLKWESLQLDQFQGRLEPFTLAIHQIALNGVYSRITVLKDGTLNLQHLVEQPAAAPAAAAPASTAAAPAKADPPPSTSSPRTAAAPAPTQAAGATKKQISIGAITVQGGTLAFSDNHLPQHFATTFYNLGGRVSGMSSDDSRFADVDLRGNLENRSPIQISGTINPLRDDLFVDLKIAFRDIELSPVTPYTGTYLGYTVEKGKLYLDLKYHIEKKELVSENKIFIDQFTFGNKVDSKQATSLPVKLGLALLKDRKGEIHLDVPVTGRTDDPQFSVWSLAFQALKNLLVKAATSPLSLLSSMFGGGADLSTIEFAHGTSALESSEEKKLDALAKALVDRPALKIELKGYVDREKDPEGYRHELLNRKIQNEKRLSLAKERGDSEDKADENVKVLPNEYSKYLKAVYKKEKFPKPRNVLGFVKDLPDDEMKKLIIANTVVSDANLQSLAQERSAKVMTYLVKHDGITAERVFLKKDDVYKSPAKSEQSRSRVELNAIAP